MTYRNSSIFSFDAGWYLICLATGLLGGAGAFLGISVIGSSFNLIDHPYRINYHFQLDKLESAGSVDTVFVGDSSLGAMFDSGTWNELAGHRAIHLALTGSDGYAGTFNMAQRAIKTLSPKNLVVVQSVDMLTREIAFLSYLETAENVGTIVNVPLQTAVFERIQLYLSRQFILGTVRGIIESLRGRKHNYLGNEYIRIPDIAGAPDEIQPGRRYGLSPSDINPEKTLFLEKLSELCMATGTNCLYAHGPVYEEICRNSEDYLRTAQTLIEQTKFKLVPGTPLCVPQEKLADTTDHVRQDLKSNYTRSYYNKIKEFLSY